jgi:hypothetical protein
VNGRPVQPPETTALGPNGKQTSGSFALTVPPELVETIAARVVELLRPHLAPEPDPWLNTEQAADHLSCKPDRIHDLKARRLIEYRKDGARLLFRRSWLDAYVESDRDD